MQPSLAATTAVRALVGRALDHECGRTPSDAPIDVAAEELAAAAFRQRVADLLYIHGEYLGLPAGLLEVLDRERAVLRRTMMVRLLEIGRIDRLLRDAGVPHLFVKGPALSLLTTGDADARGVGDIDVLVAPEDAAHTVAVLTGSGWERVQRLPAGGTWAWRRLLRVGNEIPLYGVACAADVHWRLDPTLDALPHFAALWSRRQRVEIGGRHVDTLSTQDAFAHVLQHAAKDEWSWLRNLVDIHRLARLPDVWTGFGPTDSQLRALMVTDDQVGLPPGVPTEVRNRFGRMGAAKRSRLLRRVARAQQRAPRTLRELPGSAALAHWRYELGASHSRRDVARMASSILLPAHALANFGSESPWTGVPRSLGRRAGRAVRQVAFGTDPLGAAEPAADPAPGGAL